LCVATARFKGGALREKVDIQGVVPALARNFSNDCEYYKHSMFETKALRELKQWAMEDLHAKKADIEDYSIDREVEDLSVIADKKNEEAGLGPGSEEEAERADDGGGEGRVGDDWPEGGEGDAVRGEYDPDGDEEVKDDGDICTGDEDSGEVTED